MSFKIKFLLFITLVMLFIGTSSCSKRSYPCPGTTSSQPRDLSLFDEEGNMKSEAAKRAKKKKKNNGLISKKQDDRLKNRRKKSLDDKPKNMKR